MTESLLHQHQAVWNKKPVLREIYRAWYRMIMAHMIAGKTLEIGAGSGNFKEFAPETLSSDIVWLPWLDLTLDAHALPFKDQVFSNIVLFDVLHHLENPMFFFTEAIRALKEGGRLILMEPYVSPASFIVYRFFHPEPLVTTQDPFAIKPREVDRKPFDANQAIPTLMLIRAQNRFQSRFPALQFKAIKKYSFFAYPLSGGFDHPSLLPLWALGPMLCVERLLSFMAPLLAFRMFAVLEKKKNPL